MQFLKPTEIRNNFFDTLESVRQGEMVCIKTPKENLYIISQKQLDRLANSSKITAFSQKIRGKILGSLENADTELKKYLILPK